jgi:AcrR family transcriptional regulator
VTGSDGEKRPRRGRWRSGEQSRRRILAAAKAGFARQGFDRTTVRGIAAEARVDPAEVHYFFKTKEQLFQAAMEPEQAALAGELLGARTLVPMHFDGYAIDPWYRPIADARERFVAATAGRPYDAPMLEPGETFEASANRGISAKMGPH